MFPTRWLEQVDFGLLVKQKETLCSLRDNAEGRSQVAIDPELVVQHLSGVIHFLDAFQDAAAASLGDSTVYPVEVGDGWRDGD